MARAKWILDLVGENFLAVYDVVADIHKERQLVGDTLEIPYFQDIVKFPALLPGDSSSLRDRYCELRWKAVKLLEVHGAVTAVDLIEGDHRWDSVIRVTVRDPKFSDVVATTEREMARLSTQAHDDESDDAGEVATTEADAPARQPVQPLLLPERVTLNWLVTHVPMSLWFWLGGTYLLVFGLGVKFGDQPVLRRLVGESEVQVASAAATAADVTFLPTDVEIGLSSADSAALPMRAEIMANVERGTATLTRRAEIVGQSYDNLYVIADQVAPKATIISVAPDRPVIRADEKGATITVELDRRSIIPRGDIVGGMPDGQKVRIGTIRLRIQFSISGKPNAADVEVPIYLRR